jgi:hypothetical protein
MNIRCTFITKSELLISSFAFLVVAGLFYKGVSSFLIEEVNPIFHGMVKNVKNQS